MNDYERVGGLSLVVEGHGLASLSREVSSGFTRVTTVVTFRGAGEEGCGEDVTYDAATHEAVLPMRSDFDLRYEGDLAGFSALLEPLLPLETDAYSRWGFESAALDLALRQNGLSLGGALGREERATRFVVSTRLGDPPDAGVVLGWLEAEPSLEFKLDAQSSWSPGLCQVLADTGRVRVVDLKGAYHGTPVDQDFDPALYRRVVESFPDVWIEDPAPCDEALALIADAQHRFSWDAPIHSVADIQALATRPGAINIKPSRFGSIARLLEAIEFCRAESIPTYGGGQFELGPGRDHIQALASIFYPDSPNDVAPRDYNHGSPRLGLPANPLEAPSPSRTGFGRG